MADAGRQRGGGGGDLSDMTDMVTAMRKVDAMHDPAEANALLTAGVQEIERLRQRVARLEGYAEGRDRMIAAARDALAIRKDDDTDPVHTIS